MNYIETFLSKLGFNEESDQSCEDNSPNESGQFQVMDIDEEFLQDHYQKENTLETNRQFQTQQGAQNKQPNTLCAKQNELLQNPHFAHQKHTQKNPQKPQSPNSIGDLQQNSHPEYPLIDLKLSKGSASTIQLDEYYMIVSNQELTKKFLTQQDWTSFYEKINNFNMNLVNIANLNISLGCSALVEKKKQKISLNLTEMNSIMQIQPHEFSKRTQFWNKIAKPPVQIKFKCFELANKKDPKTLEKYVTKLLNTLAPSILASILAEKLKPISSVQDQIQIWKSYLIKLLTLYGANDKQIGYSKGLEYIALGILVAKPFSNSKSFDSLSQKSQVSQQATACPQETYTELQTHFKYLLFTKQLRNMYFPGTPKLYQEIHLLTEQMKTEVPEIVSKLETLKVDFVKLFINYYKTFLLYKIKNPEVIRKIMELLLVYGIDIVRIMLTRIMNRNEKKILEIEEEMDLLKYLAESLVDCYFGQANSAEVVVKFKHLFILDSLTQKN